MPFFVCRESLALLGVVPITKWMVCGLLEYLSISTHQFMDRNKQYSLQLLSESHRVLSLHQIGLMVAEVLEEVFLQVPLVQKVKNT